MKLTVPLLLTLLLPTLARAADDSPKSIARAFVHALSTGDSQTALSLYEPAGPEDKAPRAIKTLADVGGAYAAFAKAAVEKFPDQAKAMQAGSLTAGMAKDIDASREAITGETAALTTGAQSAPVRFRKINGAWKITELPDLASIEADLPTLQAMARILTETAGEISAGKYKSLPEAQQVMLAKLQAPTTQPAK